MGIKPTSIKDLRYFTTPEHECSYLEGKRSTTLFADPEAIISTLIGWISKKWATHLSSTLPGLQRLRSGASSRDPL